MGNMLTRWFDNLGRRKPLVTPRTPEMIESDQAITKLTKQVTALQSLLGESLLSPELDPDRRLPGYDRQSLYRRMVHGTGQPKDSGRDISEAQRMDILRMCHQTYTFRGDAHNLVEIVVDFIIGDDLAPKADDPEDKTTQDEIEEIWTDDRSRLNMLAEEYIRSLLLEGELHLLADMSEDDGHLEFTYCPVENVDAVLQDQRRRDNYIHVKNPDQTKNHLVFFVLNNIDDKITVTRNEGGETNARYSVVETTEEGDDEVLVHGLCFSFFNLRPLGGTRGRPWLVEILDYIDIHDELIWSQVEREKLLKLFIIDVEAKDVQTPEEAKAKLRELGLASAPRDPVSVCHNDKVDINLKAPETSGRPAVELEGILRYNIYGAKGMPEHWSGSGGGSNFATARAQDVVPQRRLRRKQRQIVNMFLTIIRVALQLKANKNASSAAKDAKFDMTYLEVGGRDRQRGATILKDLMLAVQYAVSLEIITLEAANEILEQAFNEAGFTVDKKHRGLPPNAGEDFVNRVKDRLAQAGGASRQFSSRGEEEGGSDPTDLRDGKKTA